MAASTTITELNRLIETLRQERQQHTDAVAAIDAAYASLGISPKPAVRRGRKPRRVDATASAEPTSNAKPRSRRGRRTRAKDGMTGEAFLLSMLADGQRQTADINKKWTQSGRKGVANNLLGKLVNEGRVRRAKIAVGRGSVYGIAN